MGDIFDAVLELEATAFQQGQEEGQQLAAQESYDLGVQQGRLIGEELGFYAGFAETILPADPRLQPLVTQLQAALLSAQQELTASTLREVRALFRAVSSTVHFKNPWTQDDELF